MGVVVRTPLASPTCRFPPGYGAAGRFLAVATTAGILAALATWGASLKQRMTLAHEDVSRLGEAPDSARRAALRTFAVTLRETPPTTLDRLLVAWLASPLEQLGVPTHLALWSPTGLPPRDQVALDELDVVWADLDSLVRRSADTAQFASLIRGAGRHEVLVLTLAPDTIATVTIGPRSRLVAPTRFGRLVGWRAPADPPYKISLVTAAALSTADTGFRRVGRVVSATVPVRVGRGERADPSSRWRCPGSALLRCERHWSSSSMCC